MDFFKKKWVLSIVSGLLLTFSWPVSGLSLLIFFGLIPLLFVEHQIAQDKNRKKKLRLAGYSFLAFLIWNMGTTWWIVNSSVFGMIFAIFCNTSFYTLMVLLFHWAKKKLPLRTAYIFLISLWMAFEKLHLEWDFSWPWLNLGNVFSEDIHWIQWYEYTGAFGGTLWILLLNIGQFEVLKNFPPTTKNSYWIKKILPWWMGIALPIVISLIIFEQTELTSPETEVLLLQPNIDPYNEKYEFDNNDYFEMMRALTQPHITEKTKYIFTPETFFGAGPGVPLSTFDQDPLQKKINTFLQNNPKIQLITGIQSYEVYKISTPPTASANQIREGVWVDFYNSALKMQYGNNPAFYHKSKLVVGVENMPYKSFLKPLLGEILLDLGGTVSSRATQKERSVFHHSQINITVGPIICYESIYGAFVTDYVKQGAQFLGIITNDAWWGNTPGHRQLLSYARLRAIENRRSIVRSANTGISAIINAKGEITHKLAYNQKGVLKGRFAKENKITFYTRYGDYLARWAGFIFVLFLLIALSGRLKGKNKKPAE